MRNRTIATLVAAGALAATGTAGAAGSGPLGGVLGDDRKAELAQELAAELDGVGANQVEQAFEAVHENRREEMRTERAAALAAQLDGVGAEAVAAAFDKHAEEIEAARSDGERPDPGALIETLASELDKSTDEIEAALEAAREAHGEERRAEALERLEAAVEAGEIDSEQADEIRERIESGEGRPGGHRGGPGHGGPGFGGPGKPGGPGHGGPGFGGPDAGDGSEEGASTLAPSPDSDLS